MGLWTDRIMRDSFYGFHPFVNLAFFAAVIGFSMVFMHPVCLGISLICAAAYAIYIHGKKVVRTGMIFMLPMLVFIALMSPLFNHRGGTILTYLPNGNPVTLESVLYGIAAAVMLVTVITWFSCFNAVMTSDKFVYIFGRIFPALSLIFSMALRFVPRFKTQTKVIADAQRGIGRDILRGSILTRIRHGIKILSIMVTWALENSIETADSMKSRGYGLPGRTAFSIYKFTRRDAYALVYIVICAAVVITGAVTGLYHFRYFPTIRGQWTGFGTIVIFTVYFALAIFPVLVNLKEDLIWKRIESKI